MMKKKLCFVKTNSLRFQILSRFFLILVLLLVILEISQYTNMKKYLYSNKQQLLESRFSNIDIKDLILTQTPEAISKNAADFISKVIDKNFTATVIDNAGNIVTCSNISENEVGPRSKKIIEGMEKNFKEGETPDFHIGYNSQLPVPTLTSDEYTEIMEQKGKLEGFYKIVKDDSGNLQMLAFSKIGNLQSPSGLIQVSTGLKSTNDILNRQLYIFIPAAALILIVGVVLGITAFNRTLRPLYNVASTVEKINEEQLDVRLPVKCEQLEVDRLSNAFNTMLERIQVSFQKEQEIKEQMRRFVFDASHELRTPLTSIHGFVEVLLRGAAKNEKQLNLALNTILNESERLTKLVNDLLLLTKLDQNASVETKVENLSDILKEVYPQLQILAGERKIELHLEDGLIVKVNRNQIKQVILNLVQNAIQHTDDKKGIISITTKLERLSATFGVLQITDNGTGIPKEQLKNVFDRFFRSESHRSRKHGGYGLGLSIVKSIIEAHEGKIEVKSEPGNGTTFIIYLQFSQ